MESRPVRGGFLVCNVCCIRHAVCIERFTFEKGKTRGGGTAPPGPMRAEKGHSVKKTGAAEEVSRRVAGARRAL